MSDIIKTLVCLPSDVRARLDLVLFSEVEGRVPKGAIQKFFVARILEWLAWDTLALEAYGFPPGYFVKGPKEMIVALERAIAPQPETTEGEPK